MGKKKFCKKHNLKYSDYVPVCPVCRGEKMSRQEAGLEVKKRGRKLSR